PGVEPAGARQPRRPAQDPVVAAQRGEHTLERGLQIERAREGLTHLEQRREPAGVTRRGGGIGSGFGGRHNRSPTFLRGDATVNAKLSSLGPWSDASTRQHVVGPAAGGCATLPIMTFL